MNDDDVLDAVKRTLSDVRMDRPIEAIERRGRQRRRTRGVFGLSAGGGVAAVAALALALPTATPRPEPAPDPAALTPAAFTLVKQSDNTVRLTLHHQKILDPVALQSALADAGIPAAVKTHVLCTPRDKELPQAGQVYWTQRVDWPDGSPKEYPLVIAPAKMPANSLIYFSVVAVRPGGEFAKAAQFLVSKDDPMNCRPVS